MKILNNKKGVQLTMQAIIIAVLVIVILIVMILIFSKSAQNFFLGTSDCTSRGGTCKSECSSDETNHFAGNPSCDEGQICCVAKKKFLGQEE